MKFNILLFMALLCATTMNAQRVQFVGGINYSNIRLGKTTTPNTNFVEKYNAFSGYQMGLKVELGHDEDTEELGLFSLSLEALLAQKGTNYYYSGPSSRVWIDDKNIESKGNIVETKIEIANTYLKLPISISVNVNQSFSFQLGGYAAWLVRSTGTGTMNYKETVTPKQTQTPPLSPDRPATYKAKFEIPLNFDYLDGSEGAIILSDSLLCAANPALGMRPASVGAYYDREERTGLMFNRLDLGLHGGVKLEGGGWVLSARVSYGLSDVFNNEYHANPILDDNKKNVLNTNTQRNISYELSLGFSF
ncbi:MAG: hypothetical protein RIS64_1152 [Bacteroidota bacterium]|jgi:hypothetical protein